MKLCQHRHKSMGASIYYTRRFCTRRRCILDRKRIRNNAYNCEQNRSTTEGGTARGAPPKAKQALARQAKKTTVNYHDLMHAPPEKAGPWIDQILAGEMSVTG